MLLGNRQSLIFSLELDSKLWERFFQQKKKKADVQYDGVPLICLGFMKLVLLIFFLKLVYFFPAVFWMKMFYYLTSKTAFHFKYHLLLIK